MGLSANLNFNKFIALKNELFVFESKDESSKFSSGVQQNHILCTDLGTRILKFSGGLGFLYGNYKGMTGIYGFGMDSGFYELRCRFSRGLNCNWDYTEIQFAFDFKL